MIDACSLQPDIDLLPFGDQTEIGERVRTYFNVLFICSIFQIHQEKLVSLNILQNWDIWDIFVLIFCDSGHQPEWRSETENLCGQSSLPEHQHRLLGELKLLKMYKKIGDILFNV